MRRPTFTPARRVAIVVLAAITGWWYVGQMVGNATPHGKDRQRWEAPAATTPILPVNR